MEAFRNPEQLWQFCKDQGNAFRPARAEIARRLAVDTLMYEGVQWLSRSPAAADYTTNYLNRQATSWNPDTSRLRVTVNRTAKYIQKCAAATFPDRLEVDVAPPRHSPGVPGTVVANTLESATNALIDHSGLQDAWIRANHQRCIAGAWGIGMYLKDMQTAMNDGGERYSAPDQSIRCFDFDLTRLTLDPFYLDRPLHEHDFVMYSEVWTASKVRRVLGIELDEKKLSDVGTLTPVYQGMNRLSGGRLFSQYAAYATTKGVRVHQVHVRDSTGRFGLMYVLLDSRDGDQPRCVNFDNPISPYGGDGLPFMLLAAQKRGDGYGWMSDAAMLKDDQDRLNLVATLFYRHMQKNAGFQWLVDSRSMPRGKTEEEFKGMFANTVAGLAMYQGQSRDNNVSPPQLVNYPTPPPFYANLIEQHESVMREQVHRAQGHMGQTMTHVPNSTFTRALDEADQPASQRVRQDLYAGNRFVKNMAGTMLERLRRGSPSMAAILVQEGLDEKDFETLLTIDPTYPPCGMSIRESSIRFRSHVAKRNDLDAALQRQAISPMEYRIAYARDLDSPISEMDRFYTVQAQKAANAVLDGEEWKPVPLGGYSQVFVAEFRRAMLDKRARADQDTQQRLVRAVITQLQADAAERGMMAMIEAMGVGAGGAAGGQPQAAPTQGESGGGESSIDDVLAALGAQAATLAA